MQTFFMLNNPRLFNTEAKLLCHLPLNQQIFAEHLLCSSSCVLCCGFIGPKAKCCCTKIIYSQKIAFCISYRRPFVSISEQNVQLKVAKCLTNELLDNNNDTDLFVISRTLKEVSSGAGQGTTQVGWVDQGIEQAPWLFLLILLWLC